MIQELILTLAPYVVTLITVIGFIIKVTSSFRALKKEVVDMKEVKKVNDKLEEVLEENRYLKHELNKLLTRMDYKKRD